MNREEALERHARLAAQGWTRRFTAEEPRLSEMKELYRSLGLEVLVEQGALGEDEECRGCFETPGFEARYQTIYTRGEASAEKGGDEELFE